MDIVRPRSGLPRHHPVAVQRLGPTELGSVDDAVAAADERGVSHVSAPAHLPVFADVAAAAAQCGVGLIAEVIAADRPDGAVIAAWDRREIGGLRIERLGHLRDASTTLRAWRDRCSGAWIVVDTRDLEVDALPPDWPVDGSLGTARVRAIARVLDHTLAGPDRAGATAALHALMSEVTSGAPLALTPWPDARIGPPTTPGMVLAVALPGVPELQAGAPSGAVADALRLRAQHPGAFVGPLAAYSPMAALGADADDVLAFARGRDVIVVVPRAGAGALDARVTLPPGRWRDALSGATHRGELDVGAIGDVALLGRVP